MDMSEGFDVTVLGEDIERRAKPMPPKMITVNGGAYNEAWGEIYYDGGEWQTYDFAFAGAAGLIDLDWGYKDLTTNPELVNFYDDTNALASYCQFTFNLIDDNRTPQGAFEERLAHARAYYKEGWMPTDPPASHGVTEVDGFPITVTDLDFAASVTHGPVSGTSLSSYDLQTALEADGATFTTGEDYYVEVIWRGSNAGGTILSHGSQRNIICFTAA